jgi:hypothetical protein
VESVAAPLTIPQNWIVDGKGTLREKRLGFDANITGWAEEMRRTCDWDDSPPFAIGEQAEAHLQHWLAFYFDRS